MSTGKLDTSGVFQPVTVKAQTTALRLSASEVAICKNGLEFLSPNPIPKWKEVTVELRCPGDNHRISGSGVVVECAGNRHSGYVVSLILTGLTRQAQERLSLLATAQA
jgi:hypothetical protein